jgi:hypothetical protein
MMQPSRMTGLIFVAALAAALPGRPAHAGAGKGAKQDDPTLAEAIERFEKGVAFFDEEKYDAALAEFLKSYDLAPNPALLYNIGICFYETGKLVEALEHFTLFLEEKGKGMKSSLRKEVEGYIADIEDRIGYLEVTCSEDGALMKIDDVKEFKTPLSEPVPLETGFHKLVVRMAGFEPYKTEFSLATKEKKSLDVVLEEKIETVAAAVPQPEEKGKGKETEGKKKVKKEKKPEKPKKEKKMETARKPVKPELWLGLALGGGGAFAVVAAVTGGVALKKNRDMRDEEDRCESTLSHETCPDAYDLQKEGTSLMVVSNVMIGAAAAVGIAFIVLYAVEKKRSKEKKSVDKKAAANLLVAPSNLGLQVLLSF